MVAEELPEFGEGSGFNMKKREELASLKYASKRHHDKTYELEFNNSDSQKSFKYFFSFVNVFSKY